MALGSFMDKTFTVSNKKILTPKNISGSSGSDWATHDRAGQKARSQYLAPKLRSYKLDLTFRAQDGASPRKLLKYFQSKAEDGKADYFIIGNEPLSSYPFVITDMSDDWEAVLNNGTMIACTISLTIQEYL